MSCNGKRDWMDWVNFIITILTFVAVVGGFYIGITQFLVQSELNNKQLKELNAMAEIKIKVIITPTAISAGLQNTSPFEINLIPRNIGDYNTNQWEADIIFCNNVAIGLKATLK